MRAIVCSALFSLSVFAAEPPAAARPPEVDPAILARLRDAAMASDWAYGRLSELTDQIGPRMSGSPGAAAAVAHVDAAMRDAGFSVKLQPVKVTHWLRGEERAELVEYPGRRAGLTQVLHFTALGGSGSTPDKGLVAPVVVLHSLDELSTRDVKGAIVLLSVPFDQTFANNGEAGQLRVRAKVGPHSH
jgi:hypothetical protein